MYTQKTWNKAQVPLFLLYLQMFSSLSLFCLTFFSFPSQLSAHIYHWKFDCHNYIYQLSWTSIVPHSVKLNASDNLVASSRPTEIIGKNAILSLLESGKELSYIDMDMIWVA